MILLIMKRWIIGKIRVNQNDFELILLNFFNNIQEKTQIKIILNIIDINIDSYKLDSKLFLIDMII